MTDMEKVIKGLECCADSCRYGCPYNDIDQDCQTVLCMDAIALLKAQEPRVMTREELEDWDAAVFFEVFETNMYYALIENIELTAGMDGEYVLVNVVPGEHHRHIWGGEHYGSIWRCWTSKPTKEQREATPWNVHSQREYEAAVEMAEYCERYEPTYNAEDGSM